MPVRLYAICNAIFDFCLKLKPRQTLQELRVRPSGSGITQGHRQQISHRTCVGRVIDCRYEFRKRHDIRIPTGHDTKNRNGEKVAQEMTSGGRPLSSVHLLNSDQKDHV